MSVKALQMLYGINQQALEVNVKGLSHEDSLIQPAGGGNCLNWVAGHIVASRNQVLGILGEQPVWSVAQAERYKRGSAPVKEGSDARKFEEILADFTTSQERIRAGLRKLKDGDLSQKKGDQEMGEALHFLQFHEAYHIGQIGLLRRIAGKEGAIR